MLGPEASESSRRLCPCATFLGGHRGSKFRFLDTLEGKSVSSVGPEGGATPWAKYPRIIQRGEALEAPTGQRTHQAWEVLAFYPERLMGEGQRPFMLG